MSLNVDGVDPPPPPTYRLVFILTNPLCFATNYHVVDQMPSLNDVLHDALTCITSELWKEKLMPPINIYMWIVYRFLPYLKTCVHTD